MKALISRLHKRKAGIFVVVVASVVASVALASVPPPAQAEQWQTASNDPASPMNSWYATAEVKAKLATYATHNPVTGQRVGGALAAIDVVDPIPGYSRAAQAATTPNAPATTPTVTPPKTTPTTTPPVVITYPPQQRATFYSGAAVANMNPTGAMVGLPTAPKQQVLGMVGHPWWLYDHLDDFIKYYKDLQTMVVRLPVEWKTIEATRGTYDFSQYDTVLNRLADERFTIIVQFSGVPKWAADTHGDTRCEGYLHDTDSDRWCGVLPQYRADMQRVAQAIVKRYPYIRQYEFWNEPELFPYVGADVGDYLNLLYPFYESVKAVDPTIQVAATTLAGWDYVGWLYNVVDAYHDKQRPFDAIAYHPYNFGSAVGDDGRIMPILYPRIVELHNNMVARDDGNKPLWLTEVGWQQNENLTVQMQAERLTAMLGWLADKPYIANVDLHMLHDWNYERFGLMATIPDVFQKPQLIDKNTKFVPKQPFYDTFKNLVKRADVITQQQATPPNTAHVRYFPETRHSVRGIFKTTWEGRGGLTLFGYPKTGQFWEYNPADGHYYLAQYFERVRMEWHPEAAGTQYEVLFGLLGNQILMDRGWLDKAGQPVRDLTKPTKQPDPFQTDPVFFKETQQYLGGPFRAAWTAQGGLAIVGLPKTRVFQELNPDDGHYYLVQYFERARMEYHPTAPKAYQVLFGLLGNDRLRLSGKLDPATNQPITADYYNPATPEF